MLKKLQKFKRNKTIKKQIPKKKRDSKSMMNKLQFITGILPIIKDNCKILGIGNMNTKSK